MPIKFIEQSNSATDFCIASIAAMKLVDMFNCSNAMEYESLIVLIKLLSNLVIINYQNHKAS